MTSKIKIIGLLLLITLSSCAGIKPKTYYVIGETSSGNELQSSIQLKKHPNIGEIISINGERVKITKLSNKIPSNTFR